MKHALGLFAFVLLASTLRADPAVDKPLESSFLRLYSETRGFTLGRPVNIKPTPDGKHVLFLRSPAKSPKRSLFEFDVATGKTRELLTPEALLKGGEEQLTPEEKARRERMRVSAGGFADFHLDEDGKFILLPLSGKLFVFDRSTEKARELKIPAGTIQDPKWSRDGKKVAYVRDYDVYVYDLATDTETAVTKGGTETKTHGLAEFVAQEEMDRFSGYWWSPDGKHIAYDEADHTGVETWYVADPSKPDQKPLHQFYPRPGKKNVSVRLGIVPTSGGETIWVDWDRKEYEYLGSVRWDKHGPLTIQVQDRKQQVTVLLQVDPATGKLTKLLDERDPAFTNLRQDVPRWTESPLPLTDRSGFIWIGENGVGPTLQLRRGEGETFGQLVRPEERLVSLVHADERRGELVYIASTDPTESHVFVRSFPGIGVEVFPRSEKPIRLGDGPGHESVVFSENKNVYVLTTTSPDKMPRSFVHTREKLVGELPSVAEEPGFTPKVEFEKVGGDSGFYTAITRPRDFDAKKKYPVIVDVYGGPHSLTVTKQMRSWLIPQFQADQGFIVVSIDNRGTPGRGRDWERAIYGKFGSVPIEDQVKGLKLLGDKHPEMDLDRVGVTGWSFGGYMAALSVLKRPDVYKAAVAGAPVTDWQDYDTHYTERYMGLLPENTKEYDESSLLPLAPKLERPLLLVHGTADDNVYYRHTLRLADALIRAGKEFEMMPLPGITHMVSADPTIYERYMMRATAFFRKHLGTAK
jgi:dipeptidyl-peptidase-4